MAGTQEKIELLLKIAHRLNETGVEWALGASMLLYFKGITSDFHDIDLMVADCDAECVRTILSEMGESCSSESIPNPIYRTKTFMEFLIDSAESLYAYETLLRIGYSEDGETASEAYLKLTADITLDHMLETFGGTLDGQNHSCSNHRPLSIRASLEGLDSVVHSQQFPATSYIFLEQFLSVAPVVNKILLSFSFEYSLPTS